jgi:hypothetical protein
MRCNERELSELETALEDPTFKGRRFRTLHFKGWSDGRGPAPVHPYLFDEKESFTLPLSASERTGDGVRYEAMVDLVATVGRFVESRKVGMDLKEWSRAEGIQLGQPKQWQEPEDHSTKHRHSL